mgnify:FL=1
MKTEQEAAEICGVSIEVFRQVAACTLDPGSDYDDTEAGPVYKQEAVAKAREMCIDLDLMDPDAAKPAEKKEAPPAGKKKTGRPKKEAPPVVKVAPAKPVVTIVVTNARLTNTQMVMGVLDGRKVGVRLQPGHLSKIIEGCTLQARHLQFDTYVAVTYPARRGLNAPPARV